MSKPTLTKFNVLDYLDNKEVLGAYLDEKDARIAELEAELKAQSEALAKAEEALKEAREKFHWIATSRTTQYGYFAQVRQMQSDGENARNCVDRALAAIKETKK